MTAGNPLTRAALDASLGQVAGLLLRALNACQRESAYLASVTDADLSGPDVGYNADELYLVRQFGKVCEALPALAGGADPAVAMSALGGALPYPFTQYVIPLAGPDVT